MIDFFFLADQCSFNVSAETMAAVVSVESNFNPYAIGVVGASLKRQPLNLKEALLTAKNLESKGMNFSIGLAQINKHNIKKRNLTYREVFQPCLNLSLGSQILNDCMVSARKNKTLTRHPLHAAFSCYYSGNFSRGFKPETYGGASYVEKILKQSKVIDSKPSFDFSDAISSSDSYSMPIPYVLNKTNLNSFVKKSPKNKNSKKVSSNPAIVF